MQKNVLYVIGNGFDLYHNIQSGFHDFRSFVCEYYPEVFANIEEYLPANEWWSDVESSLANMKHDKLINDLVRGELFYFINDLGSKEYDEMLYHQLHLKSQQIYHEFYECLYEWVVRLVIPDNGHQSNKVNICRNGLFVTFNYTNTLQKLYGIPRENIFHVHGSTEDGFGSFIFGHGISPYNNFSMISREKIEQTTPVIFFGRVSADSIDENELGYRRYDEDNTELEHHFDLANIVFNDYMTSSHKDAKSIIEYNNGIFDHLKDIERVYVLGHSLSENDHPYFKRISESVSDVCHWHISYYGKEEKLSHEKTIPDLDIKSFELFQISEADYYL